jgi:type IV pilus assembly protein PilF
MKPGRLLLLAAVLLTACSSEPTFRSENGADTPAEINAKLGLNYMRHGEYDVAEAKLKRALKENPRLGEAHHYLAELYRRTERYDEAKDHFRLALKYMPDDPNLQNNFGVFLCGQGDYREAIDLFVKVAASRDYKRPDDAYANAGLCALRIPDEKLGEMYLRRALAINKQLPNALYHMARLSFDHGQYMRARAFIERYASAAQPTPQSLLLGARIELALGDRATAEDYAARLATSFPDAKETRDAKALFPIDRPE